MKCANCGTESDGNFCPSCGAPLNAANCARCSAKLVPGARFCTQCGSATGAAAASSSGSNLPWYLGAGVLILIIAILALPMITGGPEMEPAPGTSGATSPAAPFAGGADGTPPPLTGTPREQADRLFNRIMQARSAGDTANVLFFAPMGIQAYENARPLDADGLFHLASIHSAAGNYDAAITVAQEILESHPQHLLGLAIAGEAALAAGRDDEGRAWFSRFLEAYPTEIARSDITEYQDHSGILPEYLNAARAIVAQR